MASRILRTLLAPAAFAAVLGQESCLEDDVSLMQIAAHTGKVGAKASHADKQAPAPEVSSMTDNTGFLCIEGNTASMSQIVSFPRGTPLAQFNSHMPHVPGASCASRGYTQALGTDMCQGHISNSTVWVRPSTTPDALQTFSDFVREGWKFNGRMRHLAPEIVEKWTVCLACGGGAPGEGYRWLGTNRTYTLEECGNLLEEVQTAMRATYGRTGSFVPDGESVCFEGPYQYMVDSLTMTQQTPYRDLFDGAYVQEGTCAQRGYDKIRDPVDDCWPLATKNVRSATEDADILNWVFGPDGFQNTLTNADHSYGLPAGLSANLTACFACQAGGPFRDRGMILVSDGSLSNYPGLYDRERCHAYLYRVCVDYPDSGAATPYVCESGMNDLNWVFTERPFEPVHTGLV